MLANLVILTIIIVQALIREYNSGNIDLNEFKAESQFKVQFLEKNKQDLNQLELKLEAESTIEMCKEIINGSSKQNRAHDNLRYS
jgi:hypothetical protein